MVVARYSCMINGFTSIAIAKLDIMDTLEEVKIGVAYKLDGKLLESMPREFTVSMVIKHTVFFSTLYRNVLLYKSSFSSCLGCVSSV